MATEDISIHIVLPIVVGIIIGIVEDYFVYKDEGMTGGKQFLGDIWHAMLFSILGVLVATNVPWLLSLGIIPEFILNIPGFVDANGNSLIISIIITLFMLVKITASHAVKGVSGNGFKEKLWHKLVIALAIGFAPYYIMFLYEPLSPIQAMVPWLPF